MGQGGRPGGGGAAKRCKITEEGPKQFARRARGEREEISRVAGVWRSALEGSGRGRGRRHQRAAAARVAGGLKEAVQRELHEARAGGLLLLRGLPLQLPLPPAQPQAGEPPPAVIHGLHRCQADHTPNASLHAVRRPSQPDISEGGGGRGRRWRSGHRARGGEGMCVCVSYRWSARWREAGTAGEGKKALLSMRQSWKGHQPDKATEWSDLKLDRVAEWTKALH